MKIFHLVSIYFVNRNYRIFPKEVYSLLIPVELQKVELLGYYQNPFYQHRLTVITYCWCIVSILHGKLKFPPLYHNTTSRTKDFNLTDWSQGPSQDMIVTLKSFSVLVKHRVKEVIVLPILLIWIEYSKDITDLLKWTYLANPVIDCESFKVPSQSSFLQKNYDIITFILGQSRSLTM